jgi:hypothetical protein
MYGLVKGPAAIQAGKPPKTAAKPDMDLSGSIEPDQDETLRLGVPLLGRWSEYRNLWILIGGGVLAACLLIVTAWQLVGPLFRPGVPPVAEPKGDGVQLVQQEKDGPKNVGVPDDGKKKGPEETKPKDLETKPDKNLLDKKEQPKEAPMVVVVPVPIENVIVDVPYEPASVESKAIGQYVANTKEPSVLLEKTDKGRWERLVAKNRVFSARPLVSLPGSKSLVVLDNAVDLVLWGNLPELTLDPMLLESRIIVHMNPKLDADLTLARGRLVITNHKKNDDARVRVRFNDSTADKEDYFDIVLLGKDASIVIERYCELDPEEPFYPNPKDPQRLGPSAWMTCFAYNNSASIRFGQVSYRLDKGQPVLQWQSRTRELVPPRKEFRPAWMDGIPPLKSDNDKLSRTLAVKAHERLAGLLETKSIDAALTQILQGVQKAQVQEMASKEKRLSPETFFQWQHAWRCLGAIDDTTTLFGEFAQEKTPTIIRVHEMQRLADWLAWDRDHDYQLLKVLQRAPFNYSNTASVKVMELFHRIPSKEADNPDTYIRLIEGLNNPLLPIRALSHWHLFAMVPQGRNIPYDAAAQPAARRQAVAEWQRLIPEGKLPPPPKKEKP